MNRTREVSGKKEARQPQSRQSQQGFPGFCFLGSPGAPVSAGEERGPPQRRVRNSSEHVRKLPESELSNTGILATKRGVAQSECITCKDAVDLIRGRLLVERTVSGDPCSFSVFTVVAKSCGTCLPFV